MSTHTFRYGDGALQGITVLLLEDHADTRDALKAGLEQTGARVVATDTAQAAIFEFEHHHPDVLVVDLELPEVDGWDFLAAVRRLPTYQGSRVPAIAVTCHT